MDERAIRVLEEMRDLVREQGIRQERALALQEASIATQQRWKRSASEWPRGIAGHWNSSRPEPMPGVIPLRPWYGGANVRRVER
jgi:hypothetical protein